MTNVHFIHIYSKHVKQSNVYDYDMFAAFKIIMKINVWLWHVCSTWIMLIMYIRNTWIIMEINVWSWHVRSTWIIMAIYFGNLYVVVDIGEKSLLLIRSIYFLDPNPHLASLLFGNMYNVGGGGGTRAGVQLSTNLESPPIMENLRCDWAPISNRFYLI